MPPRIDFRKKKNRKEDTFFGDPTKEEVEGISARIKELKKSNRPEALSIALAQTEFNLRKDKEKEERAKKIERKSLR